MRTLVGALTIAATIAGSTAASAAAGAQAPTLHPSLTLVEYGRPVTLSGHAPPGVTVVLEANRFPFRAGYHSVSSARANSAGDYSLSARPSHATRYRALVGGGAQRLRSAAVSVYVEDRVSVLSCSLCTGTNAPGSHTLMVKYSAQAPPGKIAVRGPVYFYYGLVDGSNPPSKINLAKKVSLHRSGHTLSYSFGYGVDFPASPFQFRVAACFRDDESKDGVGLPGHHHCGDRTLSRQQYLAYLG